MASIASWYNNQYAPWNRMRRIHTAPYVAQANSGASRNAVAATAGLQTGTQDVVINMGHIVPDVPAAEAGKQSSDTLFGPSIGVVAGGPDWTDSIDSEKDEELTPDIVKAWIAKSKEPNEPTTTLQALVNLKRPTIRLHPLAHDDPSASSDSHLHLPHHHAHGLEFEFDCDAPRCAISLTVVGIPAHLAEELHIHTDHTASSKVISDPENKGQDHLQIFNTVVEGGFGRKLNLAEGAVLELAHLEAATRAADAAAAEAAAKAATSSANREQVDNAPEHEAAAETANARKKLALFRRRIANRTSVQSSATLAPSTAPPVTGPALAVVDAETTAPAVTEGSPLQLTPSTLPSTQAGLQTMIREAAARRKREEEGGVKVFIRLSALNADGRPVEPKNEQTTYLHIVRMGSRESRVEPENEEDDGRPWVVKVVKREAKIGQHRFHLHEIYGLSSHSAPAHPLAPTAEVPSTHTYPPSGDAAPAAINVAPESDPISECLVCLSVPREVVLLPCRHLVACRDCAVNMIEFGAGGTVTQNDADATANNATTAAVPPAGAAANENAENAEGTNGENDPNGAQAVPVTVPPPVPAQPPRRKRKAKGWYCPVCRQPYTSMLRITTTPPVLKDDPAKRASVSSSVDHPLEGSVPIQDEDSTAGPMTTNSTGVFASLPRPGFLRHFSRSQGNGANEIGGTASLDLERGL